MIREWFVSMKASTFILCSLRGCWLPRCFASFVLLGCLLKNPHHFSTTIPNTKFISFMCKCESVRVLIHWWCSWMQHTDSCISRRTCILSPQRARHRATVRCWSHWSSFAACLPSICVHHTWLKHLYGFLLFPRTTSMTFLEFELLVMAKESNMKLCSERVEVCCFSWSLPGSIWSASLVLMLAPFSLLVVPVANMRACWSSRSTWKIRDKATRCTYIVQC